MKSIIENVIERKDYNLNVILKKIDTLYIEDKLNLEDKQELENKAREYAKPENSYATPQTQIDALSKEVKALELTVTRLSKRIFELENKNTIVEDTEKNTIAEETIEEYPEYVQPTGSHDAYNIGNKITFEEKKYESTINNNVWSPIVYPQGWKEVIEEKTVDEILSENIEEPFAE